MYTISGNAAKVFVEITKRHPFARNSIYRLPYSSLNTNPLYFEEDPIGSLAESDNVNVISWTAKISSLARSEKPEDAIGLFKRMLMSEHRPNYVTILSVICCAGALESQHLSQEIQGLVIKMGFESETPVVTALLGVYSLWDMKIARKLFDEMPNRDLVLWSAMISVCVKNRMPIEAFDFFREMQFHGLEPNNVSIVSILPACANLMAFEFGRQVHCFSIKRVFYYHTNVQNSLLDMYAKCRNLNSSIRIFDGIPNKDLISWRTVIRGCIENKNPQKAMNLFSKMRFLGFELDEYIIMVVIEASNQAEKHDFGLGFHAILLKCGLLYSLSIVTSLLQMYSKFGEVELARVLFDHLPKKDLIAWTAMISAHAQSGDFQGAFDTFEKMKMANEKPNEITFVGLLRACSSGSKQDIGESIHAHVMKSGYSSNEFLASALIDLYCKFGRIRQGKSIFDKISNKDLICWSSMINGYGINGYGNEALETFSMMLKSGIRPNGVIFISVLSACSHSGLEYEAWNLFYEMEERYGVRPELPHYACMVDLLSRRGNIEDAIEFVTQMPIEPDKRIWGAILSGCRTTRSSDIVDLVAERLLTLDPKNASYYVILSNLYAEQGRWEDVERLRKLVDEKGLKKEIGYSITEANL